VPPLLHARSSVVFPQLVVRGAVLTHNTFSEHSPLISPILRRHCGHTDDEIMRVSAFVDIELQRAVSLLLIATLSSHACSSQYKVLEE
jgi:hypothetical protein